MASSDFYVNSLPHMPAIAGNILRLVRDGTNVSFAELEKTVRVDPGLTANVLRVANSALYGRQKEVTNLRLAISLLGFKNIRNMVVLITASQFLEQQKHNKYYQRYWEHAVSSAFLARKMCRMSGLDSIEEEAFLGGLLHNIGQLAFMTKRPEEYHAILEKAKNKDGRLRELEKAWAGLDHLELGSALMISWNFPSIYCDIAKEHGNETVSSRYSRLIMLVEVAGFVANNILYYEDDPVDLARVQNHCARLGLSLSDVKTMAAGVNKGLFDDPFYKECLSFFQHKAA